MCKFNYTICQSCSSRLPCRLYSGHEYCKEHLNAYPWHRDHPQRKYLMVEESDECGNLGYQDKGIIFRTKPEDRDEQFSDFGCSNHEFVEEDGVSGPKCPYHKPGGLKEQLIKQRIRQEKAKAKSQRREERKKLDGEEGCCIVQ